MQGLLPHSTVATDRLTVAARLRPGPITILVPVLRLLQKTPEDGRMGFVVHNS